MTHWDDDFTESLRDLGQTWRGLGTVLESLGDLVGPWEYPQALRPDAARATSLTEAVLAERREYSRWLVETNEFAINALTNRVSYTVGWGSQLAVEVLPEAQLDPAERSAVETWLREWAERNEWARRQQEIRWRMDRDGECFLRFFDGGEGIMLVRYVEPEDVVAPASGARAGGMGIETKPYDREQVTGYWIKTEDRVVEWVASDIQHRRLDTDGSALRGSPLLWPARQNLERAQKILRNMSAVAEIQAAIALIRKHAQASSATITSLVDRVATSKAKDATGTTRSVQQFGPGTILDASAATDYQFPAAGVDPSKFVAALQAALRAPAAMLVMPEWMFTADASNGNYASSLVAEAPATKNFERLQWRDAEYDRQLLRRALTQAVRAGRIPPEVAAAVRLTSTPPSVAVRDRNQESEVAVRLIEVGILSKRTATRDFGLDFEQEQAHIEEESLGSGSPLTSQRSDLPL